MRPADLFVAAHTRKVTSCIRVLTGTATMKILDKQIKPTPAESARVLGVTSINTIPVGLVGCGRWGRLILRDLLALGCEVTVASRSEVNRQIALDQGAASAVDSAAGLPAVAGIVVATPTSTHADVVEEMLARDVPIFCEKPLTDDPARAWQLVDKGRNRVFVMDKWRYHPAVERLAEIARRQELGPIVGLRTTRVQPGRIHHDVDPVWILAPHDLSIGLEILGYVPQPRAAVAEYCGDAVMGLVGMLGDDPWMVLEVSASHAEYRREVRLVCREGTALLSDSHSGCLQIVRPGGRSGRGEPIEEQWPVSDEMPLLRELRAFVDHVKGGPPPRTSATDAATIVTTLAQLRELAGAGRRGQQP